MKWDRRTVILVALSAAFSLGTVCQHVDAATASVTLLPGKLAITGSPAAANYAIASTNETTRTYTGNFDVAIVDATGARAGWRIQATISPLINDSGTVVPVRSSAITAASAVAVTGRAPVSTLSYPRSFRLDGDTIFSAAPLSGVGRSVVAFTTELVIPTENAEMDQYAPALTLSISAGP